MPFIPHTPDDVQAMLGAIGAPSLDALFDEIPEAIRAAGLTQVPEGVSELEMMQLMEARAAADSGLTCFLGAGCYDHHIPAAVWDITARGEFMTAYTPYQAEASQGTLQLIYEYQSMMAALMDMDVSNASVYDGGSGLGEAMLMALRANKKNKSRRVLVPETLHPLSRAAAGNIVGPQGIDVSTLPAAGGRIDVAALSAEDDFAAVVVQQPNVLGLLEDVDAVVRVAREKQALVIALVNPLAMAVLKPPGQWGDDGADIACGDGQPFGIPMASGGPSFGFMTAKQALVRQMPGRIIGRTEDLDGRTGYALTLQAREQHIRRAKATSNICTNQGLLVTAATIHLALLGPEGLRQAASACHANTRALVNALVEIDGVSVAESGAYFHEAPLALPKPAEEVAEAMLGHGILAGWPLGRLDDARANQLLVCATEKRTQSDIAAYAAALREVLA